MGRYEQIRKRLRLDEPETMMAPVMAVMMVMMIDRIERERYLRVLTKICMVKTLLVRLKGSCVDRLSLSGYHESTTVVVVRSGRGEVGVEVVGGRRKRRKRLGEEEERRRSWLNRTDQAAKAKVKVNGGRRVSKA